MLSAADWERMRTEMAQVRSDRSVDVEFRRGDTTLDPQEVRVEAVGRGYRLQSDAARESQTPVVVFGASDLDVAVDDRFTMDDVLYRIVFISVNRDVDTQAEAVAVE
jgi:hypothetical protein